MSRRSVRLPIPFLQVATDYLAVVTAYFATFLVRFHSGWGERLFAALNQALGVRDTGQLPGRFESFYLISAPRITTLITITVVLLYALRDLYPARRFLRRRPVAWNVVVANAIALALFYVYFYLRRNVFHPRSIFATVLAINAVLCVSYRSALDALLSLLRRRWGVDRYPAVILGSNEEAQFLQVLLDESRPHGICVAERVDCDPGPAFRESLAALEAAARRHDAGMIISADKRLRIPQIMEVLETADRLGVAVKVLSDRMDVLVSRARLTVDLIRGVPLVHFEAPRAGGADALRRALARAASAALLVLLSPLMVLIAAWIRLTSRGPVLFVQERIGVNRKPFRMLKFRTMYERADELQAQVEEFNESGQGLFKMRKDPRVTPVGRLLRRFSLDELPQLINVIRGDMTFIGPRPLPRRDFENYYEEWHYSRHGGLPGLTCLWQVSGRSELDFHDMCILDVYYLRNRSLVLDLQIFLRTFWVVLFGKGAY